MIYRSINTGFFLLSSLGMFIIIWQQYTVMTTMEEETTSLQVSESHDQYGGRRQLPLSFGENN